MTQNRRNKPKNSRKRSSKKSGGVQQGPPSAATSYKGPFRLPKKNMNMDLTVVEVSNLFNASSSGSGVFAGVVANNLASFLDTTNLVALYDEWRCLSLEVLYVPVAEDSVIATLAYSVAYGVVDNDNSTALTAATQAVDYASVKPFALNRKMFLKWKMNGPEDSGFINNSGTPTVWFKYFASGLTNSTTYGTLIAKALFQFRGRI